MKRATRGLAILLGASAPLAVAVAARAETKEECSALYDGTQTLREKGHLREARQRALACSTSSCGVHVRKDCTRWLAEIEASLPTIVFTAQDGKGAETAAVRVTVDGRLLSERLDGNAVAIDPGERTLLFELEGSEALEKRVVIRQG